MENNIRVNEPVKWCDEHTIDLIRKIRNDLIKDFLDERHLLSWIDLHYRMKELSKVKMELIRKELKELLIVPVDTVHYAPIIQHIRENNSASLSDRHEALFYEELERILKKYIY